MSIKDDLVSSRPISPSEFLEFPVDEGRDLLGADGLLEGVGDLAATMDHPFSSSTTMDHPFSSSTTMDHPFSHTFNQFFSGNGFDPFTDPFRDFSTTYQLDGVDTKPKRSNPFHSGILCLDDDSDEDDFYDVSSSLGAPVKHRVLGLDADVDGDSLYGDGLDLGATDDLKVEGPVEGRPGPMELEDLSSEDEPMPEESAAVASTAASAAPAVAADKEPEREREQIPKDIECSVDFEEIDDMLEKKLEGCVKSYRRKADGKIIDVKTRHTLRHIGKDPFEVLPDGWIEVVHESGMPIYLNRKTRIVSLSKPYHIGRGSARKHEIPQSAIPCYQYRLAKQKRDQENLSANADVLTIQEPGKTNVVPVIRKPPEQNRSPPEQNISANPTEKDSSPSQNVIPEAVPPQPSAPSPPPPSIYSQSHSRPEEVVPFLSSSPSPPPPLVSDDSSPPLPPPEMTPPPPPPLTPSFRQPPLPPLPPLPSVSTPSSLPPPPSPLTPLSPIGYSATSESVTSLPPLPSLNDSTATRLNDSTAPPPSLSSSLPAECPFKRLPRPMNAGGNSINGDPPKDEAAVEAKPEKENGKAPLIIKAKDLFNYCTSLFEFDSYTVKRFRSWKDRRDHMKVMKKIRPQIQSKLITYKLPGDPTAMGKAKLGRQFQLNPVGKSPICVLHEYVQHVLKIAPEYAYRELENPTEPYSCTVLLKGVEYGTGTGSSKKTAKLQAAKATMKVLIPHLYEKASVDEESISDTISFFDDIKVEDPRVPELSQKSGQPVPYQILIECLKRNYGMGNTDISMSMELGKNPKRFSRFTMTVGKHTKTVRCKNKKFGKQISAQGILQLLHPHVNSWGSLLRLYGYDSRQRNELRKRAEEQAVTELQSRAKPNRPNNAILDKLKAEMKKLDALRIAYEKTRANPTFTPADKNDLPYNKTALPSLDL